MNLFITFNILNKDYSGLPTYYNNLLKSVENIVILNLNVDNVEKLKFDRIDNGNNVIIDCDIPNYKKMFYNEIVNVLYKVIEDFKITNIISPDFLFQQYLNYVDFKKLNIKYTLFIHLLNIGMMNTFIKQPYYDDIEFYIPDLARNCNNENTAMESCDYIITNSHFTSNEVKKYYNKENIFTSPLGVNKDEFKYSPSSSGKTLYFGRMTVQKGIYYLFKDISENLKLYQENPLIVSGEGELENGFIKGMFYDKTIDYRGLLNKKEIKKLLEEVEFCIFPSIYEPWCLALNEAMSMGKVCIVSNNDSGMKEQIINGLNGFVFDFENDSIINFINNLKTEDLEEIKKNARDTAFDEKFHFDKIKEILKKIDTE